MAKIKPSIERALDISTIHITFQDSKILQSHAASKDLGDLIVYEKGEYGWFIYVSLDRSDFKEWIEPMQAAGLSDDFLNIVRFAHRHKCKWIEMDRDGAQYDKLPTHEW